MMLKVVDSQGNVSEVNATQWDVADGYVNFYNWSGRIAMMACDNVVLVKRADVPKPKAEMTEAETPVTLQVKTHDGRVMEIKRFASFSERSKSSASVRTLPTIGAQS